MSTTDAPKGTTRRPKSAKPEPKPWSTAEDAAGWREVARGRHHPRGPKIRLTLELDDERSAWLDREAERAGIGYSALVLGLIDRERGTAAEKPAP